MTKDYRLADIRSLIGQKSEPIIMEVEKGAIQRFCSAVGDTNPLFTDSAYAKHTPYGEIICPPGFFGLPVKEPERGPVSGALAQVMEAFTNAGFPLMLNAGTEFELFKPIYPEDMLVASTGIADIFEREGKTGAMLFGILESTYINQNGDMVAKVRITMIGRSTK